MDYREIQRLARDPASVRKIARVLLTVPGLSRQIDFLSDMAEIKGGITTRQGEFLVGIRDDMQEVANYRDFNVAGLIRKCWIARMTSARTTSNHREAGGPRHDQAPGW
jgi:hypothetical protein